jgi:hypothetical protein
MSPGGADRSGPIRAGRPAGRRARRALAGLAIAALLVAFVAGAKGPTQGTADRPVNSFLADHLLVTWYGNPWTARMGVLGGQTGAARARALQRQAGAYVPFTRKSVAGAYHLVAVVAQCLPGPDRLWRRREAPAVIDALLAEARANGFRLILDIQPGRAKLLDEAVWLTPFLRTEGVDLAIDSEFHMAECETPGVHVGATSAADVNAVIDLLERIIREEALGAKVLIVHQYRLDMLIDKPRIRASRLVDVVLNMDGFGSRALKLATYRDVMRQPLAFAGIKLFFRQDTDLFEPADVMRLEPTPSVIVYQ